MIKVVNHPLIDQAFDNGVAYGIRVMMARFASAFYTVLNDEVIWKLSAELIAKYDNEGKRGKVSDDEFAYELFALIIERYGSPKLQPRPEFKPFEGESAKVDAVAVEAPVDPPLSPVDKLIKENKPTAKKKTTKKKKPNSH